MLRGLDPLVSKGGNLTHMHDCPNFYFKAKDLISPSAFRSFPRGANSPAELGRLLGLRLGLRYERNSVEWCEEALPALSGGAVAKGRQHRRDRSHKEREGGIMPHVAVAPSPHSRCV
jgi:hypothetical protein